MPNSNHTGLPTSMCAHCNVCKFTDTQEKQFRGPRSKFKANTKRLPPVSISVRLDSPRVSKFLDRILEARKSRVKVDVREDEVICSFCGKATPKMTMTEGIVEINKFETIRLIGDDSFDTDFSHIPKHAVACPDCSTEIKPLTRADGSIKHWGTKQRPLSD